jgi:predicted PurR-regulated permease PerM
MLVKKKVLIYTAGILLVILMALFLYLFRAKLTAILMPFLVAVIIAYLLKPMVAKLEAKRIPPSAGILIIYFVLSILVIGATVFVVPELINNTKDLMSTLPDLADNYQKMFNRYMSYIQSSKWSPDIKNAIYKEVQNGSAAAQDYVMETLRKGLNAFIKTLTILFNLAISMIIAYYFIKDAKFFREYFLSLTPRKWRNGLISTGREINAILSNFIQGQLLTALIVGILDAVALMIVKVNILWFLVS